MIKATIGMHPTHHAAPQRILVIDDNPSIHADFTKILGSPIGAQSELEQAEAALFGETSAPAAVSESRFQLEFASQGEEGFRKVGAAVAAGQPFAVAFVDGRMPPGWDGIETIARLWEADPQLQVVLCTAYSDHSWTEMSRRLGRSEHFLILKKPFDNIEVVQLAHALTNKWLVTAQAKAYTEHLDAMVQERTRELHEANIRLERAAAESRSLAEIAAAANRAKTEFLTVVSHEMLTPMNGVIGLARYLEGTSLDSEQQDSVRDIVASGERMLAMVSQVLDYIEADSPGAGESSAAIDLAAAAREVADQWQAKAAAKELPLFVNSPAAPVLAHAHAPRFRRALAALVDNAIKYSTPRCGPVTISFEKSDSGGVRCLVRDTGAGIPAGRHESLFRAFGQLDGSLSRQHEGMGLGLALARKWMESMGGSVSYSPGPVRGSIFALTLPAAQAEENVPHAA